MWKMWGIILNDWLIVQLLSIADILQSAPSLIRYNYFSFEQSSIPFAYA